MKQECDVVQDLMLMCIDGTASEKSHEIVAAHVAECQPCAGVYEELKQQVHVVTSDSGACKSFDDTVRRLRRVKRRRFLLSVAAVVLIGLLVLAIGARSVAYLREEKRVEMTAEDVQVTLSRRENGDVIVNRQQDVPWTLFSQHIAPDVDGVMRLKFYRYWLAESKLESEWASSYRFDMLEWVEGEGLYFVTPIVTGAQHVESGGEFRTLVRELRFGDVVLYRHGEALPLVSDGLEEYMRLHDRLYGGRSGVHLVVLGEGGAAALEEQLREARERLAPDIPEWQ